MKHKLMIIALIALMCVVPLASATVHNYNVSQVNENEGVRTNLVVSRSHQTNISSIQSLTITGCNPYGGHKPAYDKTGTFELKNQTNTTLGTGTYSSQYEADSNPYCPYAGTIKHEYTFSTYSNPYPGIVDTWKLWFNNGIGYYGDGALTDAEPWKSTFSPRDQPSPIAGGYVFTYTAIDEPPPVANFTGSPISGPAPLYVLFNDTSTGEFGTCSYNWSLTPASGISAGAMGTMENHAASFSVPGNYTISHGVSCGTGSNISTKTDYITVLNATTDYITTAFAAMDAPRWVQLAGSSISLLDVENNSWKNATPSATGYLEITTLNNHTIDAYATMLGYDDADLLAQPAWGGGTYNILMYPENYGNVSAGNVTLYVTVYGSDVTTLSGAEVDVTWEPWAENIKQSVTDSSGMVSFVVPNQSTIYIAAEKQGYTGLATSIDSGNGDGGNAAVYKELTLQRNYLTPTATQTTLPGGGTPTPAVTILPGCEDPTSDECREARQDYLTDDTLEQITAYAPLFWLAILIGLFKLISKGW